MKLKLTLFGFLVATFLTQAQTPNATTTTVGKGIVEGKIIDKKTSYPLSYVNVLVKEEGKLISGTITNEKGIFEINNLPLKNFTVEIQYIGYHSITKKVSFTQTNTSINLQTLALEENATELSQVDIVQERSIIEQKTDRKIINVGKDLLSAGATAAEIMNNIPSVSVDAQTNEISLRGNTNVRVLIDGKPTTIEASQILKQIPSSSIKQIELITNPSAKYNPEGMSGMINIILNKNSKIGFNGSVNNGVTFGKTPKLNSSFDMNYKTGKVNMYANYGLNTGKNSNNGYINTTETGEEDKQTFQFENNNSSHLAKIGFDYYLNEKNTLSAYTSQNISKEIGNSNVFIDYLDSSSTDFSQLFNNTTKDYTQTYNFDYKKEFKKEGQFLEFEINYTNGDNTEDSYYSDPEANYVTNKRNNTLINLDYTNPLSETTKLEVGLESRNENTKNNFLLDEAYNSNFEYDRSIFSGYATISKQWGKWGAQLGARLEQYEAQAVFKQVDEDDANFEDDRFSLYPSLYFNYNPSEKNAYNLSLSRRVDRPSISQVNPIREWSTPLIESTGNPDLLPQFTNSVELNYTRKIKLGSITSGLFYRQINDEITRTLSENPDDASQLILSYDNLDSNNAYGVEVSGNLAFTKWYNANISFDAYNKKTKGVVSSEYVEVNSTSFNGRISNTFIASKEVRFQLSSIYRGRDFGLQFIRKPMWKIDLGTSITLLKGNGTLTVRYSDLFNTMNYHFTGDTPKEQEGQFNWESQTAYIGFNYRFGAGKNKAMQRKTRDTNETQGSGGF
jgi:hypothetical protein